MMALTLRDLGGFLPRGSAKALHTAVLSWGMGNQVRTGGSGSPLPHELLPSPRATASRCAKACLEAAELALLHSPCISALIVAPILQPRSACANMQGALGIQSTADQHEPGTLL